MFRKSSKKNSADFQLSTISPQRFTKRHLFHRKLSLDFFLNWIIIIQRNRKFLLMCTFFMNYWFFPSFPFAGQWPPAQTLQLLSDQWRLKYCSSSHCCYSRNPSPLLCKRGKYLMLIRSTHSLYWVRSGWCGGIEWPRESKEGSSACQHQDLQPLLSLHVTHVQLYSHFHCFNYFHPSFL